MMMAGALEATAALVRQGIVVSAGHSKVNFVIMI